MKFILTAGGTGGHIYPALSVLDEIKKDKKNEYLYIGTEDRMESELIPGMGIPFVGLEIYGLSKTDIIRNIKNIGKRFYLFCSDFCKPEFQYNT